MKTNISILIFWGICTLSCRTARVSTNKTSHQAQQKFQSYQFSDSLLRQWYFYSDSSFLYHPDSGLIARSGYIRMKERREQSLLQQLDYKHDEQQTYSFMEKQQEKKSHAKRYWLLVLLLLAPGLWAYVSYRSLKK